MFRMSVRQCRQNAVTLFAVSFTTRLKSLAFGERFLASFMAAWFLVWLSVPSAWRRKRTAEEVRITMGGWSRGMAGLVVPGSYSH